MKQIRSYFVQELPNGVFTLTINTLDKWVDYKLYSHYHIQIEDEDLLLDDFLPKIEVIWTRSSYIDKDQIVVHYVPYYKEWLKNGQIKTIKDVIFEQ